MEVTNVADMCAWAGSGKEYMATVPRPAVVLLKIGRPKIESVKSGA